VRIQPIALSPVSHAAETGDFLHAAGRERLGSADYRRTPSRHRPEIPVRLRLTPKDSSFYDLFTKAADNLVVGAGLLTELLGADKADRAALEDRMRDAEHAGDEVTHQIYQQLNTSFITPFDREDIYLLASRLDDVMDYMEAAVDLTVLYQVEALPAGVADQIDVLVRAADLTAEAMPRLRSMKELREYWIEVNRLENQADQVYRRLLALLFSGEYDALTVMKLREIVESLESAADAFEHVANTVEAIVVKES
jgi:predicted phosphate transport protein (TIGR00153 family)